MISETITIDAGPAIGELDALAGAAEGAAAKIDAAFKGIKVPSLGGSGAGNMARSMDAAAAKMQAAVDKMEASFAKLKAVGAEAGAAMGDIGKAGAESAAGLGDASKAANDAAASYARLGKASRDSAALMDEQAVASKRVAKASAESAAAGEGFFSKHKEAILGTGLALGWAVDRAMKFNASMTLLSTQAGVSTKQMPELTKGVLELAGQVGQSPGNLAESLYHVESNMSSLGIKAPQALHMVKVAAEGASVGHANLVDTTNALTAAVASGIPGVKSYDQAMGVLNATVGAGDMSMQDLADAMGTGALAAIKGYGANIKDAGAALATFGDNNIRGSTAGTELRMSVEALAVPAASAKKELAALGLTTSTLADTMQNHGMLAALDQLNAKFKEHGITAKNEGQVLTDLFGKKAGVGLSILMEQLGRVESKYPELTRGANEFGKAWDKTLQTPQQKLHNLEQGTQALAITAGNVLMPYANKALSGLDTGLEWLQQHSLANKGLALGAGALVVGGIGKGLFSGVESSLQGLGKIGSALKIPGLDKLANLGGARASGSLAAVATSGDAAAAALGRLAGVASEESVIGAPGTIAGSRAAAVVQEEESADGLGGLLKGGAGGLMTGSLVAAMAIPLAAQADKAIQAHLGNTQASGYAQIGTGALAGAATGAAVGSVIPGLGTAVGAISGAIIGGVTTALRDHKVWNEVAGAPSPPGKPRAAAPKQQPWQLPLPGNVKQMPGITTPPGKDPTLGWAIADAVDRKRHAVASGFDRARHDTASAADFIGGSWDQTRHQVASFGQQFAELFGYTPPKPPKGPSVAPLGYTNQYPSGKPFYGEQPGGVAQPIAVTPSRGPTEMGIAAHPGVQLTIPAPKPIKIPPPDTSAVTAVKAKLTADLSSVSVKPAKVPAPDMSAANGAKGKATSLGSDITSAIQGAMKPAKMPPPNLSAAQAAAGKAHGIGSSISAGLASGILSGEGAVVAAATQVANAAAAAMAKAAQTHSPSKKTKKTGTDIAAGLVVGLQGGQSAVDAAASALGKSATKAADISAIDAASKKLLGEVPKGDTALTAILKADTKDLERMARQRTRLEAEISNSEQLAKSTISSASIMNALNAVNPAGAEPIAPAAIVQGKQFQAASMKQFAAELGKLQKEGLNATDLSQIAQAGPDQGLGIAQGIDSGGKQAIQQLNKLQRQMQASAAQIGNVGGVAMTQAAKDMGQGLATGLKSELGSLDKAIEHLAKSMVAGVETHTKKAKAAAKKAGASTASAAAAGASDAAASGSGAPTSAAATKAGRDSLVAAGASLSHAGASLSAAAAALNSAATALQKSAAGGSQPGSPGSAPRVPVAAHPVAGGGGGRVAPSAPAYGGGGPGGGGYLPFSGGGGGTTHVHYHQSVTLQVSGHVMTENDLVDVVQNGLLNKGVNNWQSGIHVPGRSL